MNQPFQRGPFFVYQDIKAGHDYRYQPTTCEDLTARRGVSCTARRMIPDQQPGTVQIVVEFADSEKVAVDGLALRGIRERLRVA